jgi:dCTP deaminase
MSVKPDRWIRRMSLDHKMIEPFTDRQVREGVISYGVSSYGYDIRVADEFQIFTNVNSTIVDPKHFDPRSLVPFKGEARCGIIVNVTPFEPEWEGFVTLEISNTTPLPAKIYANEGLCQVIFFESDEDCEVSYKDKKGKYQAQSGIVLPRL